MQLTRRVEHLGCVSLTPPGSPCGQSCHQLAVPCPQDSLRCCQKRCSLSNEVSSAMVVRINTTAKGFSCVCHPVNPPVLAYRSHIYSAEYHSKPWICCQFCVHFAASAAHGRPAFRHFSCPAAASCCNLSVVRGGLFDSDRPDSFRQKSFNILLLSYNTQGSRAPAPTMLFPFYYLLTLATALIPTVAAVASTDSYTDADPAQSGYLPNHNMDPAVVDSAGFGLLWKVPFNVNEQVRKTSRLLCYFEILRISIFSISSWFTRLSCHLCWCKLLTSMLSFTQNL